MNRPQQTIPPDAPQGRPVPSVERAATWLQRIGAAAMLLLLVFSSVASTVALRRASSLPQSSSTDAGVHFKYTPPATAVAPVIFDAGANSIAVSAATDVSAGTMSGADKAKLDTYPASAYAAGANITIDAGTISATVGGTTPGPLSLVDVANTGLSSIVVLDSPGPPNSIGNQWWQPSLTATSPGWRLYWLYSGGGGDVVTVSLWDTGHNTAGSPLATQTLTITSSNVYTGVWAGGAVSIIPYHTYGTSMSCAAGVSALRGSNAGMAQLGSFGILPGQYGLWSGPHLYWWEGGIEYADLGGPFGHGHSNINTYAPVEATIVP